MTLMPEMSANSFIEYVTRLLAGPSQLYPLPEFDPKAVAAEVERRLRVEHRYERHADQTAAQPGLLSAELLKQLRDEATYGVCSPSKRLMFHKAINILETLTAQLAKIEAERDAVKTEHRKLVMAGVARQQILNCLQNIEIPNLRAQLATAKADAMPTTPPEGYAEGVEAAAGYHDEQANEWYAYAKRWEQQGDTGKKLAQNCREYAKQHRTDAAAIRALSRQPLPLPPGGE